MPGKIPRSRLLCGLLLVLVVLPYAHAVEPPPALGQEFAVGKVSGFAPYVQEVPSVAAGSGVLLAVWQDRRNQADYDIYGVLTDEDGVPLDESFVISSVTIASGEAVIGAYANQRYPAVAFNGTDFLVAWVDDRETGEPAHIYGARVTTSGEVLDKNGFAVSTSDTVGQGFPSVASDGVDWLVVYEQQTSLGNWDVHGAKVNANGTVAGRTAICFRATNERSPDVVWTGSKYLLVWEDDRNAESTGSDVYACTVDSTGGAPTTGKVISTAPDSSTTGAIGAQTAPSVALGSGTTCLVVWQDQRASEGSPVLDVYGTRLTTSVYVLDQGGIAIDTETGDQGIPDVAWNGESFTVTWRDKSAAWKVRTGRITTGGLKIDGPGYDVSSGSTGSNGPAVAVCNGKSLIVWQILHVTESNILGAVFSSDGNVSGEQILSVSAQDQKDATAAFDGVNYVVVWVDKRTGSDCLYGARVAIDGTLLDPPQGVALTSPSGAQARPAIVWGGSSYLLVWQEGAGSSTNIKGIRLSRSLKRLDSYPIYICSDDMEQTSPALAWNGSNYLVVWVDKRNAGAPNYYTDIFGAQVDSNGVVTPLMSAVSMYNTNQLAPSVASDGTNFLVTWEDYRTGPSTIYCARVSGLGTVMDATGVLVSSETGYKQSPRIVFDGTNYLVAWADGRSGLTDIYAVRMNSSAARVDATDIAVCSVGTANEVYPSIAWTGSNHYAVWEDNRNFSTAQSDVRLVRLGQDVGRIDAEDTPVFNSAYAEARPVAVSAGENTAMVVCSRNIYSINRVFAIICGNLPVPAVATVADAKAREDGSELRMIGLIVTAGTDQLGDCCYIEDESRACGIKVVTAETVHEGDAIDINGTIETVAGERQITATSVTPASSGNTVPSPVGMMVRSVGGGPGEYTPGTVGGAGLASTGLLIRTWGRVTSFGTDYFTISDGSTRPLGEAMRVKVLCPAGVAPLETGFVIVTGISSVESSEAGFIPVLRPRKAEDMQTAGD